MRCADILHVIEEHYPLSYALDWDNCGLQTGRFDKDVQTIYIALDAGDAVIADAVINHADLLITHHPLLFNGIKQIHDQDLSQKDNRADSEGDVLLCHAYQL